MPDRSTPTKDVECVSQRLRYNIEQLPENLHGVAVPDAATVEHRKVVEQNVERRTANLPCGQKNTLPSRALGNAFLPFAEPQSTLRANTANSKSPAHDPCVGREPVNNAPPGLPACRDAGMLAAYGQALIWPCCRSIGWFFIESSTTKPIAKILFFHKRWKPSARSGTHLPSCCGRHGRDNRRCRENAERGTRNCPARRSVCELAACQIVGVF